MTTQAKIQSQYQYVVTYDSYGDGVNDDWGSAAQNTSEEAIKASSIPLGVLNARLEFVQWDGDRPITTTSIVTDECYYCGEKELTFPNGTVHGFRYPNGYDCMYCNCN